MFDAVVVTLCVESIANRAALVVRLKELAPVHCSLTSSLAPPSSETEDAAAGKRAATDAKGIGSGPSSGQMSKKNKTR
jgi:hypothetical protein